MNFKVQPESLIRKATFIVALSLSVISFKAAAGELTFGGFSEMSLMASDSTTPSSSGNTFTQGGIDLYLTKSLDPKTTILAEIVFEISPANEAILDPERIWIQHEINSWFMVKAGRVHTALGYWNETFHHGSWLQTSATRPTIFSFEDDAGILPVHSIGLEFRGKGKMGIGNLGYIANIGNGRGINADPPQTGKDYDDNKSANILVYYELPNTNYLRFGFVYYKDKLSTTSEFVSDPDQPNVKTARAGMDETITGAHIIWRPGNTEVIFEGFIIDHAIDTATVTALAEKDTSLNAMYVQVSHKLNDYTPYVRYETLSGDSSADDTYLGVKAKTENKTTVAGVRYDLTYTSAVTLEMTMVEKMVASTVTEDSSSLGLKWSYAW